MNEIFNAKPTPYKTRIRKWGGNNIMSKGQVNFAKDNEYYTPKRIVKYFGEFDYDPATTKEKADNYNAGKIDAVKGILQMLDTLEMALAAPCTDDNYKKGIELTYTTAINGMVAMGVEQIDAQGQPFDPNFHNAVMQQEAEGVEPGTVVNVFQKGYKMGDKIIRPAAVVVSC